MIGRFFHRGLNLSDEVVARVNGELDEGRAIVGVLAWDTEVDAVTGKLSELGGTTQSVEVAEVAPA